MSDGPSPAGWTDIAARAALRDIFDAALAGRIEVLEASHPTPDVMSEEAGHRILAAVMSVSSPPPRLPWPQRLMLQPRLVSHRSCLATRLRARAVKSALSWRALP